MRIGIAAIAAGLAFAAPACGQAAQGKPQADGRAPTVYLFEDGNDDDPVIMRRAQTTEIHPNWLKPSDYPAAALSEGITGSVRVELFIGEDDSLLQCRIIDQWTVYALREVLCPILRERGTFRHALTVDGTPTSGKFEMTANFDMVTPAPSSNEPVTVLLMPRAWETEAKPLDPKALTMRNAPRDTFKTDKVSAFLKISAEGAVTRCNIGLTTGTDAGDMAFCAHLRGVRFAPALDRAGKPVASSLFVMPRVTR